MEIAMSFTKPSPTPDTSSSGIERVHGAFAKARAEGRCALLPFITAGFPDLATTERLLRELPAAGADIIELGIPFSDPIADGPVIAESMHRALLAGVTPDAVFSAVARVAPTIPVLAMVSISIVEKMGAAEFIRRGVECGLAGFIVADADPATAVTLSDPAPARLACATLWIFQRDLSTCSRAPESRANATMRLRSRNACSRFVP